MDDLFLQPPHFPVLRCLYLPDLFHVYKWVQFAVDVMTAVKYCRTESTDMILLIANVFSVPTTFHLRWFSVHLCSFLAWIAVSLRFWHILFLSLSCFSASAGVSSVWTYRVHSTKNERSVIIYLRVSKCCQ